MESASRALFNRGVSPQKWRRRNMVFLDSNKSGWWFGTFFMFPYIGKNNPN